jgi:hypothetical protein
LGLKAEGRSPSGFGQGLPELLRGPRNASRPWGLGILLCFVRRTAGAQTMPGSVGQPTALARTPKACLRWCGGGAQNVRGAGDVFPARRRHLLCGARRPSGFGQGLPELLRGPRNASRPWCLGILLCFVRRTAGAQTMPGSVGQPIALARTPKACLRWSGGCSKCQGCRGRVPCPPEASFMRGAQAVGVRARSAGTPSRAS